MGKKTKEQIERQRAFRKAKAQRRGASKGAARFLLLVGVIIIGAVGWFGFEVYSGYKRIFPDREESVSTSTKIAKPDYGSEISAWAYVQIYVERQLKNPGSADFPFGGHRDVKDLGKGLYAFDSYVESTNSFGGIVRTRFRGNIRRVDGGWKMEEIEFYQ